MKAIEERAEKAWSVYEYRDGCLYHTTFQDGYTIGATEQKAVDDESIKKLKEDRNAFIAFCHNIINGMYISVEEAAREQLGYLQEEE